MGTGNFSTFFAHACPKALAQSAVATLVAFILVDDAASLKTTRVDVTLAHRPSEESLTTVARRRAVVFAGRSVVTDRTAGALCGTGSPREVATGRRGVVERGLHSGTGTVVQITAAASAASQVHVTHLLSVCIQAQLQH